MKKQKKGKTNKLLYDALMALYDNDKQFRNSMNLLMKEAKQAAKTKESDKHEKQ